MAFELLKEEIALLAGRINAQPHDKHELQLMLREKLNELKAFGMPAPRDLVELEAALDQELSDSVRTPGSKP